MTTHSLDQPRRKRRAELNQVIEIIQASIPVGAQLGSLDAAQVQAILKERFEDIETDLVTIKTALQVITPISGHAEQHLADGDDPIPLATELIDGLLSPMDKIKLNAINLNSGSIGAPISGVAGAVHGEEHLSDGNDPIPLATVLQAGLFSAADKTKLEVINLAELQESIAKSVPTSQDFGVMTDDETYLFALNHKIAPNTPLLVLVDGSAKRLGADFEIISGATFDSINWISGYVDAGEWVYIIYYRA